MGATSAISWRGMLNELFPEATGRELDRLFHVCAPYFQYGRDLVTEKAKVEWRMILAGRIQGTP